MNKNKKTKSPMFDKKFRDISAIMKVLSNRKQSQMAEEIMQSLIEKKFISKTKASKIIDNEVKRTWAGSFYFFEYSKCFAKCSRCDSLCTPGSPVCISFKNKPFCLECLTAEEKKNPNPLYSEYIANKSEEINNQDEENETSDVKFLPDVISNIVSDEETKIVEKEASNGILEDDCDLATGKEPKTNV